MIKKISILGVVIFLILLSVFFFHVKRPVNNSNKNFPTGVKLEGASGVSENMRITSVFGQNKAIPTKYTCDGQNVNPPLSFSDVPVEAKSLVLIVDDPDAPTGTWNHWLVWNIKPGTTEIAENSVPEGSIQGETSFGSKKYGGPCPPSGTHRYFFKIYAIDLMLNIPETTDNISLENIIRDHILSQAELVGTYKK